ncbi:TDT family transporter [Pseudoalteromonas sp. BDTF-M6]|uniref:TDT family transporter n=1 Tax=Pseudoalteromonas sp. BDTF-M6 TaxID=2796132 RepID=UPI001BB05862|nr:TDT family transporter [Pseudoalteromonas sp. BDTF-M6]MBS3797647.1 TDT family transporter [Pseudoalteromonas sp. BDTF-M6]
MTMSKQESRLTKVPTPLAGLALGIASLGWCWENIAGMNGVAQATGALIATALLLLVLAKFITHPRTLVEDLRHPITGSVVPTFAMATMVVSSALSVITPLLAKGLWLLAILLHSGFFALFVYHRLSDFHLEHMVPSWFIPPIGIIVADVTFPGGTLRPIAEALLIFGMAMYALMLPLMLYRLLFNEQVADTAKPTLAVLAAPASLSLAGYLSLVHSPSPLVIGVLLTLAVLMTSVVYLAFFKLLRLPFSPGYAAFTFPLVIGATALFKVADWMTVTGWQAREIGWVISLAQLELMVATSIVVYVCGCYLHHYRPQASEVKSSATPI